MMTKLVLLAMMGAACFAVAAHGLDAGKPVTGEGDKILIAYFSKTNNTATIARYIQENVGGELFHVTTQKPYPADYRETTRLARQEQDQNERPALALTVQAEEMAKYDVLFLGYPNWWGTIPMALFTFLESYDLTGKTIVPFCTHEGSGLGRSVEDIQKLAPTATVLKGLPIRGGSVSGAEKEVAEWLHGLEW